MCDMFTTDIFKDIEPPSSKSYSLEGVKIPTNQDVYFLAKWHELFDRYCVARIFARKTKEKCCGYWFNPVGEKYLNEVELMFQSYLYETALIYYNIIVDLSWTLTYVSAEYAIYKFDSSGNIVNTENIHGVIPIDEAYNMLRNIENNVSRPNSAGNPFEYIKKMSPEFTEAVNIIVEFWRKFCQSEIRSKYNYIKHKGMLTYEEINKYNNTRFFSININNVMCPSDIKDVQKVTNLEESINELIKFDDEQLFPYIKKLINNLNNTIKPSPMIL